MKLVVGLDEISYADTGRVGGKAVAAWYCDRPDFMHEVC